MYEGLVQKQLFCLHETFKQVDTPYFWFTVELSRVCLSVIDILFITYDYVCNWLNYTLFFRAKALLDDFFVNKEGGDNDKRFTVHAMGHCHIDTGKVKPKQTSVPYVLTNKRILLIN